MANKHENMPKLVSNQGDATTCPSEWFKLKRPIYLLLVRLKIVKQKFSSTASTV